MESNNLEQMWVNILLIMGLIVLGFILIVLIILLGKYAFILYRDVALLSAFLLDLWDFLVGAFSALGIISTVILMQNKNKL